MDNVIHRWCVATRANSSSDWTIDHSGYCQLEAYSRCSTLLSAGMEHTNVIMFCANEDVEDEIEVIIEQLNAQRLLRSELSPNQGDLL